jgi:hypothetical protein
VGHPVYSSTAFCYPPCKGYTRDETIVRLGETQNHPGSPSRQSLYAQGHKEDTKKRLCGHAMPECRYVDCEGGAPSRPAEFFVLNYELDVDEI